MNTIEEMYLIRSKHDRRDHGVLKLISFANTRGVVAQELSLSLLAGEQGQLLNGDYSLEFIKRLHGAQGGRSAGALRPVNDRGEG